MTTYVLVHGGFVGGWDWADFARLLRVGDNDAYAPTLTGLGERVHLGSAATNLSTHIQDIVNVIEYEDLHDIVLTGHSYAGMVITGVADRIPERIAHLVFIDAMMPSDGQSEEDFTENTVKTRMSVENGLVLMSPPPHLNAVDAQRWTRQALPSFEEKLHLSLPLEERPFTRTFVHATEKPANAPMNMGEYARAVARVKASPHWRTFELPCGHAIHHEMPKELAQILLQLA